MFPWKVLTLLIVILATFLLPSISFASDIDFSGLDRGMSRVLELVRRVGYWIILIKCVSELIKSGLEGDTKNLWRIMISYILIYGALFFVPFALKLIEEIF